MTEPPPKFPTTPKNKIHREEAGRTQRREREREQSRSLKNELPKKKREQRRTSGENTRTTAQRERGEGPRTPEHQKKREDRRRWRRNGPKRVGKSPEMDEIVKKKRRGKKKKIGGREAYLKGAPAVGQWLFAEDSFGEAERTEEEAERT